MFAIAGLLLILGVSIYKGNTKLINAYLKTRVKEDEKPKYGKAVSKGMFTLAFTFLINGTLALFREKLGTSLILVAVLLVGLIVSTALFYSAQKRYNDGVL